MYETEDAERPAGLYRFVPDSPAGCRGGQLQMLAVRAGQRRSRTGSSRRDLGVDWVDIAQPDDAHDGEPRRGAGLRRQGREAGGATFARLEGAWYADGRIYVTRTSGGEAQMGQVWEMTQGRDSSAWCTSRQVRTC